MSRLPRVLFRSGERRALAFEAPAWWKVALALLVALLLQTTVEPYMTLRGAAPSLVLLLILWYGLRTNSAAGLMFGALAGACEDALTGWTGAAWTISSAIVGALAGRSAGTRPTESRLWLVPYVALATLARYGIYALVLRAEDRVIPLPATHFHAILWQALLNALFAYLVMMLIRQAGVSRVGFR